MIDVNFNFQTEVGGNIDPDTHSPTLQEYHRFLWSKPLPNGDLFDLQKISNCRLLYKSKSGDMTFSSDRAVADFSYWKKLQHIITQLPTEQINDFVGFTNTIGGIVIWPSNKIDGLQTINGARGFNSKITDRLDLTIECIRRYYLGESSPLFETFKRYDNFFKLFVDFKGYVDFFLYQDYVTDDYQSVKIAPPYDNFKSAPVPKSVEEYSEYMNMMIELIKARSKRMEDFAKKAC